MVLRIGVNSLFSFSLVSFPVPVSNSLLSNVGFVLSVIMFIEFITGVSLSLRVQGVNVSVLVKLSTLNDPIWG